METRPEWYQQDGDDGHLAPARKAFIKAVEIFKTSITEDTRKVAVIGQSACIEDVQAMVLEAKSHYNITRHNKSLSKWLSKLSSRVQFYGNIMDVLVQHHPEYVALAWGAMKFLFVLVNNHEAMTKSLAKGMCQRADSLPRIELVTVLYPTLKMKQAVAELYARIIRFFIRADQWYKESKLLHVLHSFTRPIELRYTDLIDEVESYSRVIDNLASAGAQAEQRDIHLKIQDIARKQKESNAVIWEMQQLIISYQSINSAATIDTNQRLSDIQVSQVMAFTSGTCTLDPAKALQYCAMRCNQRLVRSKSKAQPFWLSSKFQTWKDSQISALVVFKGNYTSRFEVKDFGVNIIKLMRDSKLPVIWILKATDQNALEAPSVIDVLKNLTSQALCLNPTLRNERSFSLSCAKFQTAETETEWLDLLFSVLEGIPLIYIVVDVEAVGPYYSGLDCSFAWPSAFLEVFQRSAERQLKTVVKVILMSYGSNDSTAMSQKGVEDLVIPVTRTQMNSASAKLRIPFRSRGGRNGKLTYNQARRQNLAL